MMDSLNPENIRLLGNKSFADGFSSPWIVKLPVMIELTDGKEYYLEV